ncbi:hypothetical protein Pint_03434 [Pistacia integerrima]|uniref:Uncharacterized protein n=1 Tax=Pistacia integerrima TaxID=434235 RepID=A0ACC0ZK24_9ROSI|nr:hypothetical protein Pint_03434 [Pistacia integerrima]
MENGQSMNDVGAHDSLMMTTLDRRDHNKGRNDIMARRLKNRERQRRYRARKRLEADLKKPTVINQPLTPQVDLQLNASLSNCVDRVYCKRNWKKDARRASIFKGEEDTINGSVKPAFNYTTDSQTLLPPGNKAETSLENKFVSSLGLVNIETNKTKLRRRDWKAEARNKKS